MNPGLSWLETFYDREREATIGIYEAVDEDQIRGHAYAAGIPGDEVSVVDVVHPEDVGIGETVAEFGLVRPAIAPNAGPSRLYLIDRDFTSWTDDELAAAAVRSKLCVSWLPGLRWIESFCDRASAAVTCVYEFRTEQSIRDHAETAHLPISAIHEVELIRPEDIEAPPPAADLARSTASTR